VYTVQPPSMTLEKFAQEMIKTLGGRWRNDRDGDFWEVSENGFILQAEPFASAHSEGVTCGFDCSLSHVEFTRVANSIMGDKRDDCVPIKWFQKGAEVANEDALAHQIELQMIELVNELKSASLDHFLEIFSGPLPHGPSTPQICHLTALAWNGNLDQLIDYQQSFERGHVTGFVPMITADMIDRALFIAAERAQQRANPLPQSW
jgi:hypothetical protein